MRLFCMKYTATNLRAHLYEVLDSVAGSGVPVRIQRKGVELAVIRVEKPKKKRLPKTLPNLIVGDPDDLIASPWVWNDKQ
jgi:antitoxin (DNA-binding transcriptional repressor) of toxin-antitoxin stability system